MVVVVVEAFGGRGEGTRAGDGDSNGFTSDIGCHIYVPGITKRYIDATNSSAIACCKSALGISAGTLYGAGGGGGDDEGHQPSESGRCLS